MSHFADLHMHTTASDGEKTPAEMVEFAREKEVGFMSITDHDSISGVEEGGAKARELGIEFFSGIELSCFDQRDTHILGYNIDIAHPKLLRVIGHLTHQRQERSERILHKLREGGYHLQKEDVMKHCKGGVIGRPHIAQAMVDKGYGGDTKEIFKRFLGAAAPYYVTYDKLSIKAGLDAIRSAGGLAVVAHPKLLRYDNLDMYQLLKRYKAMGLHGLEVYYPYHAEKDVKAYTQMAQELKLLITFGSDYHNSYDKTKNKLGYPDHYRHISDTMDYLREHKRKAETKKAE